MGISYGIYRTWLGAFCYLLGLKIRPSFMRGKIIVFITLIFLFPSIILVNAQVQSERKMIELDSVQQSLDAANQQIQDFKSSQTSNQWNSLSDVYSPDGRPIDVPMDTPTDISTDENSNGYTTLGYLLAGFIVAILAGIPISVKQLP